jgi:regulator of sigma D
MIVLVIFLLLIIAFLSYLLYINFRRAERAEEYCEAYVRFVSALFFQFQATRDHMKEVDRLGAFQADDEVGSVFKELDNSIENLYEFITKYVNTETEENKKTKN